MGTGEPAAAEHEAGASEGIEHDRHYFARRAAAIRKALVDAAAPHMDAINAKLIQMAKDGDAQATKLLFSYLPSRMLPVLMFVPRAR